MYDQDLDEIWRSDRRRQVLEKVNEKQCFQKTCPHNSRGHHHNRLFHQIEKFRRQGRMSEVHKWEVTLPLGHSFFV